MTDWKQWFDINGNKNLDHGAMFMMPQLNVEHMYQAFKARMLEEMKEEQK